MKYYYSYFRRSTPARMRQIVRTGLGVIAATGAFALSAYGTHQDLMANAAFLPPETTHELVQGTNPSIYTSETPEAIIEPQKTLMPSWAEIINVPNDVEIYGMIERAAVDAGIDPLVAIRVAECESNLDPYAMSTKSTAKGLYQFTDTTWEYIGATRSQYVVEESINQFVKWYPRHPEWWVCK